jgi:hypothetical protein
MKKNKERFNNYNMLNRQHEVGRTLLLGKLSKSIVIINNLYQDKRIKIHSKNNKWY